MIIGIDARMYRSETAGIGRYSRNLIKNLLKIDKINRYVLFMTEHDEREFKDDLIQADQNSEFNNWKIVKVNIPHYSLAEQAKLLNVIEKENCDLVHFLNFNYPIRFKGKFVITIHDLTLLFYPETAHETNLFKRWAFRKVIKSGISNSQKIIAPSVSTKKDILKLQKANPEKIAVIYEAADDFQLQKPSTLQITELKKKYQIGNEKILLYIGQLRAHKNIVNLTVGYNILKKVLDVKLVILGKNLDFKGDLGDTLRSGFVSDEELAVWLKLADVFVFPSVYEGFGLPGLEAMAAGLPVVCSNKSSLPEVYGGAALYFDPLDPADIADKIKMVLQRPEVRNQLIKKGKIQANKYSWEKCAKETLKIYKQSQITKSK